MRAWPCWTRESLVIASGVASGVNARRRSGWAGPIRKSFFLFSSISFFSKFWNIRWIKKCSDSKILFWKTVQIKTCSIRNLFNFEFHVQIRKICSNSNLFKLEFVQIQICSNSNLFKFEFVQIWICSDLILFRFEFVQTRFSSDSILFKFKFVQK
jgi:hypothetical protein